MRIRERRKKRRQIYVATLRRDTLKGKHDASVQASSRKQRRERSGRDNDRRGQAISHRPLGGDPRTDPKPQVQASAGAQGRDTQAERRSA